MAFAILLFVREFVKPHEKDLLYLFASVYIIIAIFSTIFSVVNYSIIMNEDNTGYYFVLMGAIIFEILYILILILALLIYYKLLKSFNSQGVYSPQESSSFLPRPKPIANYVYTFYSKPIMAFIIIFITAMVIGAAAGGTIHVPDFDGSSGDPFSMDFDFGNQDVMAGYQEGTDMISEGESRYMDIPVDGNIQYVEVFAYWQDEADEPLLENQPDSFTIEVSFGDYSRAQSGENPQGGEGIIQFNFYVEDADSYYTSSMDFIITLDYAGDQTNPLGIGPGFLDQEDNSNEIYWQITYQYYE